MEVWGKERYATDALHRYGCHRCHSYSHLSRSDFTTPPLHFPGVDFYDALSLTKLPENSWFSHAEPFTCTGMNESLLWNNLQSRRKQQMMISERFSFSYVKNQVTFIQFLFKSKKGWTLPTSAGLGGSGPRSFHPVNPIPRVFCPSLVS